MSAHARAASFFAIATAVMLAGCPRGSGQPDFETFPSLTTSNPRAEADLRAAREAAEAGDLSAAETQYQAFLQEHPSDPLVPVARLGLGRVRLAGGDVEGALPLFAQVRQADDPAVAEAGRFYEGVALHLAGRSEDAIERLEPLAGRTTDPQRSALLLRTLAAAAQRTGRVTLSLDALHRLVESEDLPDNERDEGRGLIRQIVEAAEPAQIAQAYDELPRDGFAWREVAARAIRLAFDAGEMSRVAAIVSELRAHDIPMTDELAELAVRAERTERADPRVIGAIAPLTGRARQIGQRVARGLMLATGAPADGPPGPDAPQLVMRDDGGDPARAAAAVEELVSEHRAIAIIGPLEGRAAQAAARRAQDLGVPLLTLVPDPTVTDAGAMVFRVFPGPDEEARALVAAARARGHTRFGVLRPSHAYGQRMSEAFGRAVREVGGELVATETYEAGATAFGEPIARLAERSIEALFIPDSGRTLNLIAPALAAAGLWSTRQGAAPPRGSRAVTLLAPSVGVDPRILVASRYFQGALFASAFHAPSATAAGRAFADEYEARFGEPPDLYAALAWDAFRMVRAAVEDGRETRGAVAEHLTGEALPTAGASGGLTERRTPRTGARILEVVDGAFAPVVQSPES